jgi:DNA-binding CsgD family transcriptional regulator
MRNDEGRDCTVQIGRAVLLAHVGLPPTPRHECCHGDGDPWNNDPSNLRWGTRKENIDDRERHGRSFRPRLRLTDAEVEDVRRRYGDGQSCREIGRELRIHESYVSRLVRGQRRAP